jgi:hypothetical protein
MSIGIVQEIARTSKGAPYIVVNGARLYASKCETPPTGLATGMKIDYEAEPFGDTGRDGKRPMGLKRWKPVMDASGKPETGSTVTEADILRSVSNVVGNACAAGTVKTPEELEKWFVAAHRGFVNMAKEETPRTPGEDDELPESFYQQLPPNATNKGNNPPW